MQSAKFTPDARTRTRTSPARGWGSGISRTSSTSGGPIRGIHTDRIRRDPYNVVSPVATLRAAQPARRSVAATRGNLLWRNRVELRARRGAREVSSAGVAELRRAAERPSNEVWRRKSAQLIDKQ